MKSVLVTGIKGFTGPYLSQELRKKGYKVYGSVSKKKDESSENNLIYADLLDLDSLKNLVEKIKPDKVIHLAGISFVGHSNISEIYNVNLIGTRNLLEALDSSGRCIEKIILASTANVYGRVDNTLIDENQVVKPINDYAISKASMELLVNLWRDKLPIIIARPFNYTGLGQSKNFLIPKIIEHFQNKKKSIKLGNLEIYRDFSDVRDIAEIYSELIDIEEEGEIYNICSGKLNSIKDFINIISNYAGYQIKIIENEDYSRKNEIKFLKGSNEKLFKTISKKGMRDISETIYWMYHNK